MLRSSEIGANLKKFAKENYGSSASLAEALGMKPQSFQSYTSGRSLPGTEIISKLMELGCDITWLLTGKKNTNTLDEGNEVFKLGMDYAVEKHIKDSDNKERIEMLKNELALIKQSFYKIERISYYLEQNFISEEYKSSEEDQQMEMGTYK